MKRDINDFLPEKHPVIILCRNALPLTRQAIESILTQDIPVQVYAVDNGSTDGTSEWLSTLVPHVFTHTFRPGLGVSAAWNFALTDVFRKHDHALVVNNDVRLLPETYRVLLEDGGEFVTAVSVGDPVQLLWDGVPRKRPHPDFSCYLIRKSVWQKVGAFDESMALYASDADFHLRMHKAGIEAYTIGVPFYHYASGTLKNATEMERRQIQWQADRDREAFERKWGCKVGSEPYYAKFGHTAP